METTPLGLKKPISSDSADLRVFVGDNMELIDTILSNKEGKIYKQPTAPTTPVEKDLWIDTTTTPYGWKLFDGFGWNSVGSVVEDAFHRFTTDEEKNAWNAKADAAAVSTALSNKVDAVIGKVLSSNDYTTAEKDKLANLSNYANQAVLNALSDSDGDLYYKGLPIVSGGGSVILAPEYVIKDSWNTTGTRTLPAGDNYKFYIHNTGNADLTFTIRGITIQVKTADKEEFEDIFDPFTEVTVTATSTFEATVSGLKSGSSLPYYSVKDFFSGSSNITRSFSASVYGIVISNDGTSSLTYTVNGLTLTVDAGKVIERYFDAFTEVTINSSVAYRAYITSALNAVVVGSTVADTVAPTNVTNLVATNIASTTLSLTWNASISNDVASYDIYNGATFLGNTVSTNFNVSGLTEKTQYTFNVKAKDSSNNVASGTALTITTADVTAPANATNPTITNVTQTALTLNWTASASSDVSSYDIFSGSTFKGNVTATTFNVTGLTAGTSYTFNVKAKDASGNSASGVTVNAITIPNDVTNLTTSNLTSTSLTVNWIASTGSTSYDVFNGATLLGNSTSTSYNVAGLTGNTQYTFKVIAKNSSGSSVGVTTIATTSSATVNPVTNLIAGTASISSIPYTWTGSTSTIASQELAYSTDGTNYSNPIALAANTTSYTLTGLNAGTTYTIRVVAIDASSNRSVPTTVQKGTAVAVNYSVTATPPEGTYGGTRNIVLSSTPTGATIYYTVNGATPTTSSPVYSSAIAVSTSTTLKFFAQDTVGNFTSVQTQNYTIDTVAPSPAITPTAGTPTSTTIPVSWTLSPSSDVAFYEIAYSTDNFVSNSVIASSVVNPSSTSYTVTGLSSSTFYTIRIVAIDGAGNRSTGVTANTTTAASTGLTSVTSGIIHGYDFRGGIGYTGSVTDLTGTMPLTLTNFKSDGSEGFVTGGLKHAGGGDLTTGVGYAMNNTIANLGMAIGSSFTVVMKVSLNASQYTTSFFSSNNANNGIHTYQAGLGENSNSTIGRFSIGSTSVGALKVHPTLLVRDSASTTTTIVRDDSSTAASSLPAGATPTPFIVQVTYDASTKTVSLYLNGTLNKSVALTNHMKFDGINLCSGQKVDHALLVYNRVLSGSELNQVSTDLMVLS